ncbi:Coenzyme gamma-F420-2:alpha-L-glutamate ligase [Methanosarcina lacustris Z-7289]|uniref:Coenzyme gamma-F420-2:alpha-L-glutamate ligase n=2 Tax=Methanosarcina lacustris TaxID=170861 RepID=A0A0E3S4V6_9EURY|nr:Coenzyme gamma-F420-2:alpha-L-glutamate ligase [Methanosarcina lacustris Z-7289]
MDDGADERMKGWILYKSTAAELRPDLYEIHRFIEVAGEKGIELRVVKPDQFDLIVTRDDRKSILLDGEVVSLPDFLLPRMGAGTTYFALAVIRHLERLGVRVFNSSQSIDTVKDKLYSQQILAERGISSPNTMFAKNPVNIDLVEKYLGFPLIVKALSGSMGKGIFLSETHDNFRDIMELIHVTNPNANIILQEFIKSSLGRDLRVLVIGGRAVVCMERIAPAGSFKSNYSRGGAVRKFDMTPEIQQLATETARTFGLDIAGIDLLFDGDHFKVCEANSSPGFEGIEECCEVNVAGMIYDFIREKVGEK